MQILELLITQDASTARSSINTRPASRKASPLRPPIVDNSFAGSVEKAPLLTSN